VLSLFFCGQCVRLRCSHPACTSESPDVILCSGCGRRWQGKDAPKLSGRCPACAAVDTSEQPPAAQFEAFCGALARSSVLASLLPPNRSPTARFPRPAHTGAPAPQAPALLGPSASCHCVGGPGDDGGDGGARAAPPAAAATRRARGAAQLLPLLTRRCRACVARGLPGILVSPTPLSASLDPTAPLKLYRKLSPAAAALPWVSLVPRGALPEAHAQPPPPPTLLLLRASPPAASAPPALATTAPAELLSLLPLTLHLANPMEHPCCVAVQAVAQLGGSSGSSSACSSACGRGGLGGQGCQFVRGRLGFSPPGPGGEQLQAQQPQWRWAALGARDDLAEAAPQEGTAAAAQAAWRDFPGAAAAAATAQGGSQQQQQQPHACFRVFGNTAQCSVWVAVDGAEAGGTGGQPPRRVEVEVGLLVLMHPRALAEARGVAVGSGSSSSSGGGARAGDAAECLLSIKCLVQL
jgi:hypothetical protein